MGVVNQGVAYALGLTFPGASHKWYMGLINNVPTPVLDAGDTMVTHTNWVEALYNGPAYSQASRPEWTVGLVSNNQITNAVAVTFTMTAANTIYGILLTDAATGTGGNLFGTAQFVGGPQIVANTDTIQVTLTLTGASS